MHNGKKIERKPAHPELRILLLEDSAPDAELIEHILRQSGLRFEFATAATRAQFETELSRHQPDVILSDYSLPDIDGIAALELARTRAPEVPFIFVTGVLGEEVAIDMLKRGATDYVLKLHLSRLAPAVNRALREAGERRDRQRAEEQLRVSNDQLRALTGHLQHVREQERTRIAREVHDELGQSLTALKIDLSWLSARLRGSSRLLLRKLNEMSSQVDSTIQTVRRIATELRPGILDSLGLVAAIEWQAADFQERTGIPCDVGIAVADDIAWEGEFTTACFRIFQETLTNIMRHARATRVEVRLGEIDGDFVLSVRDNGRGIADKDLAGLGSLGLTGMRERAAQIGGEIMVESLRGHGTTVTMRVPQQALVGTR